MEGCLITQEDLSRNVAKKFITIWKVGKNMSQESLRIVVVGHVDHGKSTVIGRLLYDTKSLPEGTVDKVKRIAKETGKPFEYAYLLDAFEEEQKQGITIDTTQLQFQTDTREYVIIDAPGHKEFLKNMISGASNAEAAFLIVDGKRGVEEQTKRHAYILKLLGIRQIYVLINKMDLVDYSEQRFIEVKTELTNFLTSLNLKAAGFIPISAYYGENLLKKSAKLPWYHGKSFIDTLDSIDAKEDLQKRGLRFPIQDVFKFDDRRIIAGRIESGTLNVGDEVVIYPTGRKTVVESFVSWPKPGIKQQGIAGESVGVTFRDEFFNKRGEVITAVNDPHKPIVKNIVQTNLFWMGKRPLEKGKSYKLKIATQEVIAKVIDIVKVIDATTLVEVTDADKVNLNDVAEVVFQAEQPLVYDFFGEHHETARFVVVDGYDVAGGGTLTEEYLGDVELDGTFLNDGENNYQVNLFDTYAFIRGGVVETTAFQGQFELGDTLPVVGTSYHYPESFTILAESQDKALVVVNGVFTKVLALANACDAGQAIVNTRGFKINIANPADLGEYLNEQEVLTDKTKAVFYKKWIDFAVFHEVEIEDL